MPYCPNCGIDSQHDTKFCRRCGVSLEIPDGEAATWHLPPAPVPPDPQRPTMPVGQNPTAPAQGQTYVPPAPPMPYYQPPQPHYYPPAQTGQSHISLGDWLSGGWHVYKENWLLMSLASLFGGFLSVVTIGILAGPLLMGLFRMAFRTMRGERPEFGDLFNWEGRFLQAFLAFLIAAAIYGGVAGIGRNQALGAVLSFVVTPFLTMMLGLTLPSILERKMDVAAAVNEIGKLIFSRDAFMWWVVGLVFATITWGGMVACGVGVFITLPWIISAMAVAYRDIYKIDDPNRTLH